ncbi:MAG TPA: hypothetical protein VN783_04970 [Thermoanaerobaculia bacterium]|nr:hypothetical protein [Thermoanaerobaculia bacterium]
MKHIYLWEPITVIVLIFVWWYMRRKKAAGAPPGPAKSDSGAMARVAAERMLAETARPQKPSEPPEVVYMNLRRKALATTPEELGVAGQVHNDEPYGALMEMGIADSAMTLACFADGEAGLYYQSGGGIKGGGAHDAVRRAAKELIALSGKLLPTMRPAPEQPLPGPGRVQFYVLTPRGIFGAEMDREVLGESGGGFSKLFLSAQEVATQMRQIQAQRSLGT